MNNKLVYITTGSQEEALQIIRQLLQKRLIACANLLPGVKSLYWWNDEIQEDSECVFIAKTTQANLDMVTNEIIQNHSYDCPSVTAYDITNGNPEFLKWIEEETR